MDKRRWTVQLVAQATIVAVVGGAVIYVFAFARISSMQYISGVSEKAEASSSPSKALKSTPTVEATPLLDIADYDRRMWRLANNPATSTVLKTLSATSSPKTATTSSTVTKKLLWPVKTVYPNVGAVLPYHRIIAYYGNFYSTRMGVLGEYPKEIMFSKLADEMAKWNAADPGTPAIAAINYIAVTAQESPGKDGKHRFRMPDSQLDHAVELAHEINGIVILDVQVGLSTLQSELPALEKYLKMPNVHLGLDPEFSIKTKSKPGDVIGTFSAADINYAAGYLARLVKENNLPPKVLVVHRFTRGMVTSYKQIAPLPEVQIVMDMDGWGSPAKKLGTYANFITSEPVQFTGFKIFYKNDLKKPSTRILTPQELLKLSPQPSFIQFQ